MVELIDGSKVTRGGSKIWMWQECLLAEDGSTESLNTDWAQTPQEIWDNINSQDWKDRINEEGSGEKSCSVCEQTLGDWVYVLKGGLHKTKKQKWHKFKIWRNYCSLQCFGEDLNNKKSPVHGKLK
jgi:hypothetical protein